MDTLRIGFAGCGGISNGFRSIIQERKLPALELVAAADVDAGHLEAFCQQSGARGYRDYHEMLASEELDGCFMLLPPHLHEECTLAIIDAGCHVFMEKPMALTTAGCKRIIQCAKEAGVQLAVGQILKATQPYAWVLDMANSGELGAPVAVSVLRTWSAVASRLWGSWRQEKLKSGGLLFEIGVHEIDFVNHVMGGIPQEVYALFGPVLPEATGNDYPLSYQVCARYGENRSAWWLWAQTDPVGLRYGRVHMSDGVVFWKGGEALAKRNSDGMERRPDPEPAPDANLEEVRDWVEGIRNGRPPKRFGAERGMEAVMVAEAAELSAQNARPIRLAELM